MTVRLRSVPVPFDPTELLARSDRFVLHAELGRGASAVVYEVFDRSRDERLALKLHFRKDARTRESLQTELEIAREIQHPNLVRVVEVGQLEDRPYLLMEAVDGVSLLHHVQDEKGRTAEPRLRACLVQLLAAIHALHGIQRVHRDVKPSNVRVTPEGRLVLLDLGIAAERGDLVWAEPGIGTPSYMAPEQVTGGIVGPPADLYALGVLLFELLTGALPHPESAHGQTQVKLNANAPPVRSLNPDAPPDLADLCDELLSRDPELRPEAGLVLKQLGHATQDFSRRVPLHAPGALVGREDLLQAAVATLEASRAVGHWLAIVAPAGRGKRAFVRELAARAVRPGRLLMARFQRHARSAFDGLDPLMLELSDLVNRLGSLADLGTSRYAAWLGQMFPAMRFARCLADASHDPAPTPDLSVRRRRALALLRDLVATLAKQEPLMVWLDRLSLAPDDARHVVQHVLLGVPGVLLVTTDTEPLDGMGREPDGFTLPCLPEDATLAIIDEQWLRSTGDVAPRALELAIRAQGEPWAAVELARAALRGHAENDARSSLDARLSALPEDARRMLRILAVAGRELPQQLWLEVSGLEERAFHRRMFALLEAALIERVSDWLAPAFALAHGPEEELLLSELSPRTRAELHRDLSIASSRHGEMGDDERMSHLEAAGLSLEAARRQEPLAHDAEARLGFGHAAALRARALALDPPRDRQGELRFRQLGQALLHAGQPASAAQAFARALAFSSPSEGFELRRLRAEALLRAGHVSAGMAASQEALGDVGLTVQSSEQRAALDLLWQRTLLGARGTRFRPRPRRSFSPYELSRIDALLGISLRSSTFDAVRGAELQVRALRFALREREPLRVARALALHVSQYAVDEPEPHSHSFALLREARRLSEGHGDPALSALLDLVEGGVNMYDMHPARALELCLSAEQRLLDECSDASAELWLSRLFALSAGSITGNLKALSALSERAMAEARDQRDGLLANLIALRGLSHLALWKSGAPDEADHHVAAAMRDWPAEPPYLQHFFAALSHSLIAEHRREPGQLVAHDLRVRQLSRALFMRARAPRLSLEGARATLLGIEASLHTGGARTRLVAELGAALSGFEKNRSAMAQYQALCHRPMERQLSGDLDGTQRALVSLHRYCTERGFALARLQTELAMAEVEGGSSAPKRRAEALRSLASLGMERPERVLGLLLPGLA